MVDGMFLTVLLDEHSWLINVETSRVFLAAENSILSIIRHNLSSTVAATRIRLWV